MFSGKDVRVFPKTFKYFFKGFPEIRQKQEAWREERLFLFSGTILFAERDLLLGREIGRYFLGYLTGSRPFGSP